MQWEDDFAVGIARIDEQHMALVDGIGQLEHAVAGPYRWSAVHSALVVLNNHVRVHFAVEESLMQILGYSEFDEHAAEHLRFRTALKQFEEKSLRNDTPEEMIAFLKAWWREHLVIDRKFFAAARKASAVKQAPARRAASVRWP